jgi:putative transcriptional regulator
MTEHEKMSVFEQLKSGLEDSVAYSKGNLSLKTAVLPVPPPAVSANDVRALRQSLHMSQAVFAATLNVSPRTIQSWEQGLREPSDAALRMIQIIRVNPGVVGQFFGGNGRSSRRVTTKAKRPRPSRLTTK